jgi:hypothetical protein
MFLQIRLPFFFAIGACVLSILAFNNVLEPFFLLYLISVNVFFIIISFFIQDLDIKKINKFRLPNLFTFFIPIIVISNMIEFYLLGVPIFNDQVSYHKFGLAFIHHVSVSSWILIFGLLDRSKLVVKILLLILSFSIPILIQNRDLFLLTCYSLFVVSYLSGFIRSRIIQLLFIVTVMVAFGVLGEIRSQGALAITLKNMPFSPWLSDLPSFAQWSFIYPASSIFNSVWYVSGNNELYYENINAVSEFMIFFRHIGWLSVFLFYLSLFFILNLFRYMVRINIIFFPLFIFLQYQAIMSIFSSKIFITHTLFQLVLFLVTLFIIKFVNNQRILIK